MGAELVGGYMLKINRVNYSKLTGATIAIVSLLIGLIIGIAICPQKDYSSCLDVAEQDRYIVSQDGVITDLAIQTMNGRNFSYNKSLSKCLELAR